MIIADKEMSRIVKSLRVQKSILVVEDEHDLADLIRYNLEREGYACRHAHAGDDAFEEIQRNKPDLVLMDRMLPGVSGDDIVAAMKRDPSTASIPVIVLSAKGEEADQLVGFALGADDYVTKPFSMKLLLARVAAQFRRVDATGSNDDALQAGPFRMSLSRHELFVAGTPVALTPTEFRLLKAMIKARGSVLSRDQLIDRVLGEHTAVTDRTMDVHITALRKKLGAEARWIQTIRGVGYAFREPV